MNLSAKHKAFCDEYLSNGLNATQAYKSVYKTNDKVAGASGPRLLENVRIKDYLQEQQEKTAKRLEIRKEDLIQDLLTIKQNNMEDAPPFAIKAIEVINKMLGFNASEKSEITITEQPLFLDDEPEE
jgi:phage terminase small subunit